MGKYSGLENKRILIVEDVELNQYLARHIMESWGCRVDVVDNGKKAVENIEAASYDLVLMDIQMPVMDGIEATKMIRELKDEIKSSVPIVALTANALKEECEMYMKVGMNGWLAKPFEENSLFAMVSDHISDKNTISKEITTEKKEAASEKLYNLAMVEAISGGDQEFIKKMMALFLETVPATLADLNNSAEKGDWSMTSKHAHKLKSTIDSMGIASLKQDIRTIEADGKTGANTNIILVLVKNVTAVMHQVMEQVKRDV